MSKATSKSTTSRVRRARAESSLTDPVAQLALTTADLWTAYDAIDVIAGKGQATSRHLDLQTGLWEHMRTIVGLASLMEATSLDGALFQLNLIEDALNDLIAELPEEHATLAFRRVEQRIRRLVAAASLAIEPHCDLRVREAARVYGGGTDHVPLLATQKLLTTHDPATAR